MIDDAISEGTTTRNMQVRYERARHLLRGAYSDQIVFNDVIYPTWIDESESFWYIRVVKEETGVSHEVRIVDANEKNNRLAFDNRNLAAALEEVTDKKLRANDLKFLSSYPGFNIVDLEISLVTNEARFNFADKFWCYDLTAGGLKETEKRYAFETLSPEKTSPDGSKVAFIKDHNLWAREVSSGKERQLTHDGEEYHSCQVGVMGFTMFTGYWSPDSKRFLAFQYDARQVEEVWKPIYKTEGDEVKTDIHKVKDFAMSGDDTIATFQYVAFDMETGGAEKADYPPIANDYLLNFVKLAWWGKDSKLAYFVDADRYHKTVRVVEFDTGTGNTRVVLEETADTFFKFAHFAEDQPVMTPLPETEELLWFSERSGWGHLYLYDLKTGGLKHQVTSGEWLVRNVVRYEPTRRELFLQTAGRDKIKDPYYRDLVRVNIDTGEMAPLAESNHDIEGYSTQSTPTNEWGGIKLNGVAPTGNFAVVTQSRVDTVPITYLLNRQGEKIMTIEKADISRLPEGFQWPEPVKTVADDGKTAIYGVIYRPSDFSEEKSYPVITHALNYPGSSFASKSAFNTHSWSTFSPAALAELGFIVMQFDGRGTPGRDKAFLDTSYGDYESASDLSDHIAGIRQLADCYPYIDLERAGIVSEMYGNSASQGLLKFTEFYKVGVEAQVLDNRMMVAWMIDRFTGPASNVKPLEELAGNLRGKLLLPLSTEVYTDAYGLKPVSVYRLAAALARANKDVDISYDPDCAWGMTTYQIRRGWDYLVRHLQGNVPPENFVLDGTAMWDSGALKKVRETLGGEGF